MQINAFAHSPAYYLRCASISSLAMLRKSQLRIYHGRFDPYYLWHQSYAHQFAFPIRGLGNVIESGDGVVDGPDDHRQSSEIASRASRNVLTTNRLFYRFAERYVVTFDRSCYYTYNICVYICKIRDSRVGLIPNSFTVSSHMILLYFCLFIFPIFFFMNSNIFDILCYLFM